MASLFSFIPVIEYILGTSGIGDYDSVCKAHECAGFLRECQEILDTKSKCPGDAMSLFCRLVRAGKIENWATEVDGNLDHPVNIFDVFAVKMKNAPEEMRSRFNHSLLHLVVEINLLRRNIVNTTFARDVGNAFAEMNSMIKMSLLFNGRFVQ